MDVSSGCRTLLRSWTYALLFARLFTCGVFSDELVDLHSNLSPCSSAAQQFTDDVKDFAYYASDAIIPFQQSSEQKRIPALISRVARGILTRRIETATMIVRKAVNRGVLGESLQLR